MHGAERAIGAQHSADPRPHCAATIGPLISGRSNTEIAAALGELARLGYRGVQWSATTANLRPRDLDAGSRRGLRSELRRRELTCAGIDAWIPPGHFLDPLTLDRAISALEAAVSFAADIAEPGVERPVVCTTLPGAAERGQAGAAADILTEAIAALGARAERDGIAIADHAVDGPFVASATMGIGVDPAACLASGVDPVARVASSAALLRSARLVDLARSGMRIPVGERGEARLDLIAYHVALDVASFRRLVVVDARQWPDVAGGLAVSLERWAGGSVARIAPERS